MGKGIEKFLIGTQFVTGTLSAVEGQPAENKTQENQAVVSEETQNKKSEEEIYSNLKDEKARWGFWMKGRKDLSLEQVEQIEALAVIKDLAVAYNFKNMMSDVPNGELKNIALYLNEVIKNDIQRQAFYSLQRCELIDLSKPTGELLKEDWEVIFILR
jgi:ethanolamine utilization cobalamin adenosyltransferase